MVLDWKFTQGPYRAEMPPMASPFSGQKRPVQVPAISFLLIAFSSFHFQAVQHRSVFIIWLFHMSYVLSSSILANKMAQPTLMGLRFLAR